MYQPSAQKPAYFFAEQIGPQRHRSAALHYCERHPMRLASDKTKIQTSDQIHNLCFKTRTVFISSSRR